MGNEKNEHEFDDIVQIVKENRENSAPRYGSFVESVFGEMRRMSEDKAKQIEQMQKGGRAWN